jgi:magnesium chelatase subunit D
MRLVKGAVGGLLAESAGRRDEVVVISCRGASAQVLLEPTCSPGDAVRALEYLPTGGRTPLAHALSLAAGYVNAHAAVVLVTDGHANVAHQSDDAWADALASARALGCPALVVDTEDEHAVTGRPLRLAEAMRASRVRLAELDSSQVIRLIREVS